MRVGVDARALAGGRGVTRYVQELLKELAREHPGDEWRLFVPGRQELAALGELKRLSNVVVRRHPLPGRTLFGAAAITGRPRLDRLAGGAPDVLWAPAVAPLSLTGELPFVLTVHDLSFELRPRDFTAYERLWHRLARPRALARAAQEVIVPAASTRDQLIARWGLAASSVSVVPEGVSRAAAAGDGGTTLDRLGLTPQGYILAVGALEPRKAPLLLARAYARARARGLSAQLVFAGEGRLAGRLCAPGVRLLGRVSDRELDALYSGALALATASLLEGYGLPVREALARGVPAVISDLPVFGDELSGAVLRVAPGDEEGLSHALIRIWSEDGLRSRLAAGAAPAVAGLTWNAAARRTRAVLARACGAAPAGA